MSELIHPGDEQLISLLLTSEPWKALERKLNQMEHDAFESLLHGLDGQIVAAEVAIIRKIRRLPEDSRAATG